MNNNKETAAFRTSEEDISFDDFIRKARELCHDLNQPMQAISGYADLLAMVLQKEDPQYAKVARIQSAVGQANEIITTLMSLLRSQANKSSD